jgi:hypothetical protein
MLVLLSEKEAYRIFFTQDQVGSIPKIEMKRGALFVANDKQ